MKRIITLISMFLFAGGILMAQTTTPKLSYEMVIRDADNNLLVNQPTSVGVSVYSLSDIEEEEALYTENLNLTTDENGILIVEFGQNVDWEAEGVDWITSEIRFDIDYDNDGVGDIIHIDRVFAVPYALQSPHGDLLTTDEIVRYISEINFDNDMRRILKAYHENTFGLEDGWVDTFKHYLMTHHDTIKSIILSYAPRITAQDIYNTQSTVLANSAAYNRGVQVMKEFAKDHLEDALEMAQYYIDNYTEEYNEALNSLVAKVEQNDNLYPYIKKFFERTFKEYLDEHHYITIEDCPSVNPCTLGH